MNNDDSYLLIRRQFASMAELCIRFGEDQDIELDEVDIGVADGVIAFDVSGRITGLDETTLSKVAGTEWIPTKLRMKSQDIGSDQI